MGASDVTLVIPGRNCAATLTACLAAVVPLLKRGELTEIVFVDDGSTDVTSEIAAQFPVTYVRGDDRGPGAARNLGWRRVKTSLVWFVDSDCVAEPDALRLLLTRMSDCRIAGAGGSYGNMRPDSLLATLIHEEIVERHLSMPTEVNFLGGYHVLYRREALEKVSGFDESAVNGPGRAGAEDAELAYRMVAAGYKLAFDRNSRVNHFHPTRLGSYLKTQARHGRFRVALYAQHPSRVKGDSYSGFCDHIQPPLALALLVMLPFAVFRSASIFILFSAAALVAAAMPMTSRLVARTHDLRLLAYLPFTTVRAAWRGAGAAIGVIEHFIRSGNFARLNQASSP